MRHLAYPGNVRWNEDGYRFSWRMMLTEKTGHVRFRVTDTDTGVEWLEYPERYLTPLQVERSAYQPDMIRATARIIAERAARRGVAAEVRADVFVSFNGRPAARLIDPTVDLVASARTGIAANRWTQSEP